MVFITSFFTYEMKNLKVSAYFKEQVGEESYYVKAEKYIIRTFSIRDILFIAVPKDQNAKEIEKKLEEFPEIPFVLSAQDLPKIIKKDVLEEIGLCGKYKGKEYNLILTTISRSPEDTVRKIRKIAKENGWKIYMFGNAYFSVVALDYVNRILKIFTPIGLVIMLLIFYARLRNFGAAVLAFLPTGIATVVVLGAYAMIGKIITMENVLMPIITLVMGSASAIHLSATYLSEEEKDPFLKSYNAFKSVFYPMFMASLTTIIGFLSLCFVDSPAVKELGKSGAFGITVASLSTWIFLPPLMTFIKEKKKERTDVGYFSILLKLKRKNLVFFTLFVLFFTLFIPTAKKEFNSTVFFRKNSSLLEGMRVVQSISGFNIPVFVSFKLDRKPDDPEVMELLKNFDEKIDGLASRVISPLTISNLFKKMNVPFLSSFLRKYLSFSLLYNEKDRSMLVIVFPKRIDTETHIKIKEVADSFKSAPGVRNVLVAGDTYKYIEMNEKVLKDQLKSVFIVILVITLSMIVMLKNALWGVISVVPIASTILNIFGVIGLFRIPLNIITAYVANISLGAGIDYAIHFLYALKKLKKIELALGLTGRNILANAFGIGLGFSLLLFSPLAVHVHIGILMLVSMLMASIYTLMFLCGIFAKRG